MKYTILLTIIISALTTIVTISIEHNLSPANNLMVIGLDDHAKKVLSDAKKSYFRELKFNYTNKTRKSERKMEKAKERYEQMQKKASEAIASKAMMIIKQNKAAVIIMDRDTIYADESVMLTIH